MHTPLDLQPNADKKLIGMVHVGPLPSAPNNTQSVAEIVAQATKEAKLLEDAGFDAIIIENMHDIPYVHGDDLTPDITSTMTAIACSIASSISIPFGVQILSGGNTHALAVAHATGGGFIRCENFVFAHIADEGLLSKAEAGGLLRYRRSIGAQSVKIFCDMKKKHASHAITGDLSITEVAQGAKFFGADGIIITGASTGKQTAVEDVREAREAVDLPILVGSGVSPSNAGDLLEYADALIVGSWIKNDGHWANPVDPDRAYEMVRSCRG
ncbi:MAG: BtpA/SgcQ family protein [Phycisphaerales bacterium]|nr:BtpA/SgcQ family protein [Phycisphaerales bacterium]